MTSLFRGPLALLAFAIGGCTLPSYTKVGQGEFSCPDLELPGDKSPACLECVRAHCCEVASACVADEACNVGFTTDLTPFTDVPTEFDKTLGCMQRSCDAACNVSFACEGTDYLPRKEPDADGQYPFVLGLREFAGTGADPSKVAAAADISASACSGVVVNCTPGPDSPTTDATGVVQLYGSDKAGRSVGLLDRAYVADSGDLARHPPHVLTWSEPLYQTGIPFGDLVFRTGDVINLVTEAAQKEYHSSDSHIVFYMHNCLPLRFLRLDSPHGGVSGASIALVARDSDDGAIDGIVYRTSSSYAKLGTKQSFAPGSGGAAVVAPGYWTATATATSLSPPFADMTGEFLVPKGGVGVVHLFPSSTNSR